MVAFIQKHYYSLLLTIVALLGVALANLATVSLGIYLRPSGETGMQLGEMEMPSAKKPALRDFAIIHERNIFNSAARPEEPSAVALSHQTAQRAAPSRRNLQLIGTVTAGEASLALVTVNRGKIESFHIGEEVPGGGIIAEISRFRIVIRNADGTEEIVPLYNEGAGAPVADEPNADGTSDSSGEGIQPLGENRYVIDRQAAQNARQNMPELLRQARLEPNMVGGRTEGFMIKMLRPDALLAKLGMRKGDVLVEVNGLKLDSPEKGLQVFQQLREAKNIVVGLTRNGQPMSFSYEVN